MTLHCRLGAAAAELCRHVLHVLDAEWVIRADDRHAFASKGRAAPLPRIGEAVDKTQQGIVEAVTNERERFQILDLILRWPPEAALRMASACTPSPFEAARGTSG